MLDYNLTLNSRSRDTVFFELFDDKPLTVANFLKYVNNTSVEHGSYDGSIMHRLSRNFVLQGGGYYDKKISYGNVPPYIALDPTGIIDFDNNAATPNLTVSGEYSVGATRSNVTGTVSMALSAGPNTGTNQWFVNLADNTFLDNSASGGPFTVFAKVAGDGMNLFSAFNSLSITNLNPDTNADGNRDGGPFFNYNAPKDANNQPTDGTPYLSGSSQDILVVLEKARKIDYLGSGVITNVPIAGLTFSARDAYIDTGTTFTGSGSLTIGAGRTLGIREGFSVGRNLNNHGVLQPGLQLGAITVPNYFQYSDGRLDIQLRGTTADTTYDQVNATTAAFLDGKLNVTLINGFTPAVGNSFTVLTATTINGGFASVDLPLLTAGLVWNISKSTNAYTLSVVSADYNRNGVVDTADYILWRETRNTNVSAYTGADGNGDGVVNDSDYALWRGNVGNIRGNAAAASGSLVSSPNVPEPASAFLLLIGSLFVGAYRRRRTA